MELLLVVEDCFLLAGRGLALTPDLSGPHSEGGAVYSVLVERPDGSTTSTHAHLHLDHFRPGGYKLIVYLHGIGKDEVPVGSKVWKT